MRDKLDPKTSRKEIERLSDALKIIMSNKLYDTTIDVNTMGSKRKELESWLN